MGSPWYLEHVSTHEKYILHNGDNMMGRHSSCRIVWSYVCVSREHAKMIVNSEGVVVQSMKALNGVYIDGQKVERMPVIEGSIISLGVEELPDVVPRSYPIFKLKKMVSSVEEIVLSSDDDDTRPLPPVKLSSDSKEATEFNLSKSSNFDMKNEKDSNLDEAPCCSSSNLHLPKLPELKQELVMTTTQEIRNIFGEADEAILGSVLDINPYLYNKLNNDAGGIGRSGEKIHDGDSIELDSDADNAKMPPPTMPEQKKNDEEEYDERFAMSQAVLQELKAEMAFSDGEEDFLGANGMNNVDLGSPSSQLDDDDIIIISDNEDDELYDKVADWSTKLFSQKAPDVIQMSQVYPLDDSGSDQESGSTIKKRSSPRVLRIDSSSGSSSDECSPKTNQIKRCKGLRIDSSSSSEDESERDNQTSKPFLMRRCSVRLKSITVPPEASATADDAQLFSRRQKKGPVVEKQNEEAIFTRREDIIDDEEFDFDDVDFDNIVLEATTSLKDVDVSKEKGKDAEQAKYPDASMTANVAPPSQEARDSLKKKPKAKAPRKPSARMQTRSKSCYEELLIETAEPMAKQNRKESNNYQKELVVTLCAVEDPKNIQPVPSKTVARIGQRRKTIDTRLELEKPISKTNEPKKDPKAKESKNDTAIKKGPSARLLNRSKSCYMERPIPIEKEDEPLNIVAKKNVDARSVRGPSVIEAPFLPKQCGKLRGVSAQKTDKDKEKLKVLERRFVDYQKDMKTKWFQKPKSCDEELLIETAEPMAKQNQKKTNNYQKELVVTLCAVEDPKNVQPMPSKTVARIGERRKTIDSRLELEKPISKTNEPKKDPKAKESKNETSIKKGPSARLLNRSKSCYMERPIPIAKEDEPLNIVAKKNVDARSVRVPSVIEASFLPKQCGKLRGVSAQKTDKDKEKLKVLERQRFVDYQKDMKTKWFQKPKDKKKDDKVIKDNRRDALKKLSDKPKEKEISGSGSRKRKHTTSVPTVKGSNRGGFLTCGVEGPPPKMAKKENVKPPTPPTKKTIPKRRSTIETFTQQLQAADEAIINPQPHCSRPSERKEAEKSRNQRTCNRVNFADMERYRNVAEKMKKKLKRVRFNDNVEIHYIERAKGARSNVQGRKECVKIFLSTYRERREWTLNRGKQVNDIRQHSRSILRWGNQWLKHRSVEAVANADVLMPVPHDFESFKQYREIFVPLMKLELLTTIERDYNSSKTTFDVSLKNVYCEDNYYRLVTRVNSRPFGKFVLYTLSGGNELPETFANLLEQKGIGGNAFDLTFEILKQDIPMEKINSLKHLTARPVVDSLRVELGALSAVHQLSRSPLCRRVLKPTEAVQVNSLPKEAFAYKGYSSLNEHQEDICLRIYQRVVDDANPSVTLIQGPPGTGKSMVISNLSLQCMYGKAAQLLDRKILICSHSNTAVDHIVGALSAVHRVMTRSHFMMLRFGLYDKMSMQSRHFSLEAHFRRAKEEKLKRLSVENIEVLKKQQADLKAEIQKLLEKPNLKSTYLQQQLHHKEKQLQLISDQLNPPLTQREEFDIAKMCVGRAHIVCTTLSSCVKLANYVDFFDLCIIDEATQCTEPWTLLPMRFGLRHLVLVGDTQQLPAVVLSQKAIDFGLANSMFDRIQRSLQKHLDQPVGHQLVHTKLFKLSKQYRMHPEICRWPNKYFYEDQLVNSGCTVRVSPIIPYCVINLSYTRDNSGTGNKSISNNEEAHFVAQLLTEMDKHMPSTRYSYGLISPYNNQCYALSQVIPSNMKLTPLTVDAFQGLEKDVIIISNARTRGCGFLTNYQRLNVALTRPKRCLVICGNFDDLQTVDMWRQLLDDARQRKVYFDLKREHVADLKNSLINKLLVKPHISEHPKK